MPVNKLATLWMIVAYVSLFVGPLQAQPNPPQPRVLMISPKPVGIDESSAETDLVEEDVMLNSQKIFNQSYTLPNTNPESAQSDDPVNMGVIFKNYYSPHPEGLIDWSEHGINAPPSAEELKHSRNKLKMLFPVLSLGALNKYIFAGEPVNPSGDSYTEFYDSLLVLGGSNHLADGMAELLMEFGVDAVYARAGSLIIMLLPAEYRAIHNDITLDAKRMTFEDALNHDAFKSASNQVNHIVTELSLPYVREQIDAKKFPGLDKMLAGAISSASLAAPPILFQIAWGLAHDGELAVGKMVVDSGVGFMYSTAVTSFEGVNQHGAHLYLDGAKGPEWCNPELRDCETVDDDGVYSELMAGWICYVGAEVVDIAAGMIPAPVPLNLPVKGIIPWLKSVPGQLINGGLKITPKIMKTTSKHLRKVTAYAGSDALNKKMKKGLSPYTSEAELCSSLLTFSSNLGLSVLSSMSANGGPYKTGFGQKSINALYNIGAIVTLKLVYQFGLNHAFGLSAPIYTPYDYYTQPPGTGLIYPNLVEDAGIKQMRVFKPYELYQASE